MMTPGQVALLAFLIAVLISGAVWWLIRNSRVRELELMGDHRHTLKSGDKLDISSDPDTGEETGTLNKWVVHEVEYDPERGVSTITVVETPIFKNR